MATRSGTNSIPFWGRVATPADLPNVAGSPTQKGSVETGDQAFTISDDTFWVCTDATLGAAVWESLPSSSSVIIYRPGGTPSSRVVTTYPALKAAVAAFEGVVTIYFDDSIVSPIVLPTGTWTITNPHMVWRGLGDYINPVALDLANGFVCNTTGGQCALGEFYGDVQMTGLGTPSPFPITNISVVRIFGAALATSVPIITGSAAAGSMFEAQGVQAGFTFFGAQIGSFALRATGTAQLFLEAYDGVTDNDITNWLTDDGSGCTFEVRDADTAVSLNQNQPGFSGSTLWGSFIQTLGGGLRRKRLDITHATGAYGISSIDQVLAVKTATGTISTLTLPDLSGEPLTGLDHVYEVLDVGGAAATNPITIAAPGGGTINGAATFVLSINYAKVKITTDDGLNYFVAQSTGLDPNLVKARTVTGGSDTITVKDFLLEYSNAGAVAVSLPALGSPPAGTWWTLFIQQTNAATIVTVTPATTIDGAGTLVFPTGIYSASLRSKDGSVWYSR